MADDTNSPGGGSGDGARDTSALDDTARLFGDMFDAEEADSPKSTRNDADEDDSEDGYQADDDADDDAAPAPRGNRLKLDDNAEIELADGTTVKLKDLRDGHLRQSDYTRKTQELAEHRRQVQEHFQRVSQADQQLSQQLAFTQALLSANVPQPPPIELMEQDIFAYERAKHDYGLKMQQWQGVQQSVVAQQQRAAQAREYQKAEEWNRLQEAIPELKDPKKATKFRENLLEYTRERGFKDEEIGTWLDHRVFGVLKDAMEYRRIKSGQKAALAKGQDAPPVIRPGTRNQAPSTDKQRQRQAADRELRRSGSMRAAARVIEDFLD